VRKATARAGSAARVAAAALKLPLFLGSSEPGAHDLDYRSTRDGRIDLQGVARTDQAGHATDGYANWSQDFLNARLGGGWAAKGLDRSAASRQIPA